jgi:lipopolysaccharide biosynthesis protein
MTLRQLHSNLEPGPYFEDEHAAPEAPARPAVRLIAFYLPQFHPIAENDAWWGKGFTEWTNVTKAVPRFRGHYQPHLPGALGFYDLRLPDALRAQAALARRHGIGGFCFHYYSFGGRRVLETPLNNLLANPDIDLPFCINWANEDWTRSWDGREGEVLLSQRYSPEDDIAFAEAAAPMLRDPRYIHVDGRPLLMIYRPDRLPDARATVARWRAWFTAAGVGDPYVVMAQSYDGRDPRPYGMDAAAEFPPHKVGWAVPRLNAYAKRFTRDFDGAILSYDAMVEQARAAADPPYTLFRGICPSWDNEARRPNHGHAFVNSTPAKYGAWLRWASAQALLTPRQDERLVFINAWNEWGEGAHLEPDRHFGHAYLNETTRVLGGLEEARAGNDVLTQSRLDVRQMSMVGRGRYLLRRLAGAA